MYIERYTLSISTGLRFCAPLFLFAFKPWSPVLPSLVPSCPFRFPPALSRPIGTGLRLLWENVQFFTGACAATTKKGDAPDSLTNGERGAPGTKPFACHLPVLEGHFIHDGFGREGRTQIFFLVGLGGVLLMGLTGLALVTAIVAVLQVVASFIKFGPFTITLALAPILIGAALYGPKAGAYLGGVFACMDIRSYLRVKEFYGIVLVKMVAFTVVFYLATSLLPIDESIHLTVSLLAAMPAMSSLVMMAKASGTEGDYAMGGIFVTTVCSIVTIPITYWLLQLVG